jgi:hypothetical protein
VTALLQYKLAVENEKRAFQLFLILLGENHQLTKSSDQASNKFMRAAVQHCRHMVGNLKKKKEEEVTLAIASEMIEGGRNSRRGKEEKEEEQQEKGQKVNLFITLSYLFPINEYN